LREVLVLVRKVRRQLVVQQATVAVCGCVVENSKRDVGEDVVEVPIQDSKPIGHISV